MDRVIKITAALAAVIIAFVIQGCSSDVHFEFQEPDFKVDVEFVASDMLFTADGRNSDASGEQYVPIDIKPTFGICYYKVDYPDWVELYYDNGYGRMLLQPGEWGDIYYDIETIYVCVKANSSSSPRDGVLVITATTKSPYNDGDDDAYWDWYYGHYKEAPVYEFSRTVKITQQGASAEVQ